MHAAIVANLLQSGRNYVLQQGTNKLELAIEKGKGLAAKKRVLAIEKGTA